jgi:streptogramin lyase
VTNYPGTLSEFTAQGAAALPSGISGSGMEQCYGAAIDGSGDIWVTNQNSTGGVNSGWGSTTEIATSTDTVLSGSNGYGSGGLYYPVAAAADTNGNLWFANYANSSVTLYSGGSTSSAANVSSTGKIVFPVAVAVDGGHNAWIANQGTNFITRISADTSTITTAAACCSNPAGVAVDAGGNVWVANFGAGGSLSEVSSSGTALITRQTGGGLAGPQGIAVDGAGTVWVANSRAAAGGLSEFSGAASTTPGTALSPSSGLGADAGMNQAYAIAADNAGNLWVSNFGNNTLTEFVGMAAPVKTPLNGPVQQP